MGRINTKCNTCKTDSVVAVSETRVTIAAYPCGGQQKFYSFLCNNTCELPSDGLERWNIKLADRQIISMLRESGAVVVRLAMPENPIYSDGNEDIADIFTNAILEMRSGTFPFDLLLDD